MIGVYHATLFELPKLHLYRRWVADLCVGLALLFGIVTRLESSPTYWAFIAFLLASLVIAPKQKPPRIVLALGGVLAVSLFITSAVLWFQDNFLWTVNLVIAFLAAYPMLMIFVKFSERALYPLIGMAYAQAVMLFWQVTTSDVFRPMGFIHNQNPGAALLMLSALYLLYKRQFWLALPLVAAMAIPGSRAVVIAFVAVLLIMTLRRVVPVKYMVMSVILPVILLLPVKAEVTHNLRAQNVQSAIHYATTDLDRRTTMIRAPSFVPKGIITLGDGPVHNVPLRLSMEIGILAAAAWTGLTLWALWKGRNRGIAWYALLALAGISQVDYYIFIGSFAAVWWLLVGANLTAKFSECSTLGKANRPSAAP